MLPARNSQVEEERFCGAEALVRWEDPKIGAVSPAEFIPVLEHSGSIVELDNICYMGSTVISGAAKGIVFETGNRTFLGTIARNLTGHRATTAFDKGISKVSLLLIRFMLVMVPFVFFINGFTKGIGSRLSSSPFR